jgi:hypothetical protein
LDACFIVKDSGGHKMAFVYFEDEPGRAQPPNCSHTMKRTVLRRNIAKFSELS